MFKTVILIKFATENIIKNRNIQQTFDFKNG